MFTLLMGEGVEEPERRSVMMASFSSPNPEFVKIFEQKRKDEKNTFNQTFIDVLDQILAKIKARTTTSRAFSNSIGVEVKVVDQSDVKLLQLVQTALKLNQDNINLIIALSDYFPLLFSIFETSNWNSTVHILFIDVIKTCLQVNKSKPIIDRLVENNLLVKALFDCTKGTNAFVDPQTKKFRKAYCGAVNEVGTLIHKLTNEHGQQLKACRLSSHPASLWTEFYDNYLAPIIAIERTDRDDVFAKVNKSNGYDHNIPDLLSNFQNITGIRQLNALITGGNNQNDDNQDQDDDRHNAEEFEDERDAAETHEDFGNTVEIHHGDDNNTEEQAGENDKADPPKNPFEDGEETTDPVPEPEPVEQNTKVDATETPAEPAAPETQAETPTEQPVEHKPEPETETVEQPAATEAAPVEAAAPTPEADQKPAETTPAAEDKPAEDKPVEDKPAEAEQAST